MPQWATDPLTWWTLLVFAAGFLLGFLLTIWVLTGRLPHVITEGKRDHKYVRDVITNRRRLPEAEERELFITTTPGAFPPGKTLDIEQLRGSVPEGKPGHWTVTRLDDLGSFPDIYGKHHQQWRVYGRPA